MKRFYKIVSTRKEGDGYAVLLDDRPVKTPVRALLRAPNEALADAVMKEWMVQEDMIVPDSMPITQILSTKIDRVSAERDVMAHMVLKYLDTDLVCYRTDHPPELAQAQEKAWNPLLRWFENRFGVGLEVTTGLAALTQPEEAREKVAALIEAMEDDHFTALQMVTALSGSLVVGLAFCEDEIGAQEAFDTAHVEEYFKAAIYNEEKYGPDPAQGEKDKAMMRDLQATQRYLELLKT